jgi:hypothetical protein
MLFKPLTNKSSKRGLYGVVISSGASGPWMRRLSFPVQTNTPTAGNWRHIFLTTKQNWLAAGPGGVDYVFTDGIAPQQAWAAVAAYYFGILEAGLNENGVISMARLIGCATEDAYYTMCQANRASLGLAPLPTPALMTGSLAGIPITVPPVFAFPSSMGISTNYDTSYNVIGFFLSYTWVEVWTYPASPWNWTGTGWSGATGANSPGVWEICASDQYTNSYAPPDPSTWQPILFSGPNMPSAADVLAAWIALYGALKDSGNIKFQAFYIDPATGASGPALSATAGWKAGTLEGADLSVYTGPNFKCVNTNPGTFSVSPGGAVVTMTVQGMNGYGGTITFSGVNSYYLPTGTRPGTKTLPAGTVITCTPTTLTIAPGDSGLHSVTASFVLPSTTPNYEVKLKLKAADGIQTASASNIFQITGGTGLLLNWNYLTIDPSATPLACPNPGNALVLLTLSNTGPNDIDVDMSATADNPGVALEFGTFVSVFATDDGTTLWYELSNSAPVNGMIGQTISAAGYSPAGYNVLDATITASNTGEVATVVPVDPGNMTVQGQVGLIGSAVTVPAGSMATPGTARISMLVTLPGTFPSVGIQIQLVANAGTNTAFSGVTLT